MWKLSSSVTKNTPIETPRNPAITAVEVCKNINY